MTDRILWNRRPVDARDAGDIDEIVIHDAELVHVEQTSERSWWIGIYRADGTYWHGNFSATSRGVMTFSEQENAGIELYDHTHEAGS